jgi:uncharacterized integral membrane protein
MFGIIFSAILLVLFGVLVSMNYAFTTTFNLLGARFENISVVTVATLSFAGGILFSLFIYLSGYLRYRARKALKKKSIDVSTREGLVADREANAPH